MDRVRQHTTLKAFCDAHLEARPRDGRNHYVCPNCKSGNRRGDGRGTADFHIDDTDPDKLKCFSCGWRGDLFDLAGLLNHTEDKAEQCNAVAEWAGVAGWQGSAGTSGQAYGWDDIGYVADEPQEATVSESRAAKVQSGAKVHGGEEKAQN